MQTLTFDTSCNEYLVVKVGNTKSSNSGRHENSLLDAFERSCYNATIMVTLSHSL